MILEERDVPQLVAILRLFGASISDAELRTKAGRDVFVGGAAGLLEVPIEAWDVEDDAGHVHYQLWTYYADAGVLFEGGTTKRAAVISQSSLVGDDLGSLALALEVARETVRRDHPESDLAGVSFAGERA